MPVSTNRQFLAIKTYQVRKVSLGDIRIIVQSHDSSIVDQGLVQVLRNITTPHQWHNHPVDLPHQSLLVLGRHLYSLALMP